MCFLTINKMYVSKKATITKKIIFIVLHVSKKTNVATIAWSEEKSTVVSRGWEKTV